MKNYFCLFMIIFTNIVFSQRTTESKKVDFDANFRVQTLFPIHFGNTALAKAHKPRLGFSMQMILLEFKNFKAGFGVDFTTYDITDNQLIANLSTSKYTSAYLLISYEYKLSNKLFISPTIGYGLSSLELGSRSSRFGKQSGNEFRIGAILDYRIGKSIFIFGGVNYVNNKFDIKTAPEFVSFFSDANQIQLNLGIRFGN